MALIVENIYLKMLDTLGNNATPDFVFNTGHKNYDQAPVAVLQGPYRRRRAGSNGSNRSDIESA